MGGRGDPWQSNGEALRKNKKKCRFALVDWGCEFFGSSNMQLQVKQKLLEELCLQNNANCISSIKELKADISNLIHQDKLFWQQRSRLIWLPTGDKNTKYFHNRASQRRHKNHITGVFGSEIRWCTTEDGIAKVAESYFKDLFAATPTNNIEGFFTINWKTCHPTNEWQTHPVLHFWWSPNCPFPNAPIKSTGARCYVSLLLSEIWHIVGHDVTEVVLSVLHSGHMLKKMNHTHIVLIPKKDPTHLADYRPISLGNVVSRIISKVIANLLKCILPNVVSES